MKNGTVHSDSQAKADILNMQFSSVFTIGNASNVPSLGVSPYSELPHITVYVAGVRTLLEAITPHKATGPDGIPARLLTDYAADLAPVLSHIYQASLKPRKSTSRLEACLGHTSVQERSEELSFELQTYIYHKHRLQDIGTYYT